MTVPVGPATQPRDLAAACFSILADAFFDEAGEPLPFSQPDKKDTQDDPFDVLVRNILDERLPQGVSVLSSGKNLVSPDLVVARPEETSLLIKGGWDLDPRHIVAIEVKKVKPAKDGKSGRAGGMDYNSTPPCSRVRIYAKNKQPLVVPSFYLFALHVPHGNQYLVRSLALVSGSALNQDARLYESRTGIRKKSINLGTFGDGLDRERPMLVFANPLGWKWMSGTATLIHERDDLADEQDLSRAREVIRNAFDGSRHSFWAYRRNDGRTTSETPAVDPFPTPKNRSVETSPRGRFVVDL
ncbi:hypothetical protein [Amycolatopsis japonica]